MSRPNAEDRRVAPTGTHFDYVTASDGARLRTAHWPSHAGPDAPTIVYQTGRTEFIEKGFETVYDLLERGFGVYMMDWRGQGLSHRSLPDRQKGHIESYDLYLADFQQFMTEVVLPASHEPPFLLAHSMGGHITLRHLYKYPEQFAAAIFTGPMIAIGIPRGLGGLMTGMSRISAAIRGKDAWSPGQGPFDPDAPFRDNMLTTDPDRFADLAVACEENMDLAIGGATNGWILESMKSIRILNDEDYLRGIRTPILLQYGSDDRLVSIDAIKRAGTLLPDAKMLRIEGARHEILKESDAFQNLFWNGVDEFLAGF